MKFNISMNDELFEKVENEANKLYMSRSGFISMCVTKYMNENNMFKTMEQLPAFMELAKNMNEKEVKPNDKV